MSKNAANMQQISNVKGKRATLTVGLVFCLLAFAILAYGTATFFLSKLNFLDGVNNYDFVKVCYLASLAVSFVGVILSVAGANGNVPMAKAAFFFGTLTFILSAALLVVVVLLHILIPLDAMGQLGI